MFHLRQHVTTAIQASQKQQEGLAQERDKLSEKLKRVGAEMETLKHDRMATLSEYNNGETGL